MPSLAESSSRRAFALGIALMLLFLIHAPGYAMTSEELIGALTKMGADETSLLRSSPFEIEEKQLDFLGNAKSLRVTVRSPHHPHVLRYATSPTGGVYRLKLGKTELERMRTDLKLEIRSADMALRYVQWLLEITEGPAFWLVSSMKDVPFQPVATGEDDLAKEIEDAKKKIAPVISAAKAKADRDGFTATQEAVRGSDLVRYEVAVSRQGECEIKTQILASDLPVVYVLED